VRYVVREPTPWDDAQDKQVCQVFGFELLGGVPADSIDAPCLRQVGISRQLASYTPW
jgi:hypothetical protein